MKKWGLIIGIPLLVLICVAIFHKPLLRSAANLLICTDPLTHADAVFVLSGNAYDRSKEAAILLNNGYSDLIVCTGESIPTDVLALGYFNTEAEISAIMAYREGVDSSKVAVVEKGTSTQEESEIIFNYALENSMDTVIVVSNKLHTRRVCQVFRKKFDGSKVHLIIHGAPASGYDEENWWQNEYGLIFVNNEYIKLMYYALKY